MSQFDEFNARVERAKADVDRKISAGRVDRGYENNGSGFFSGLFSGLLGELLVRVWWGILLVGGGIGVLAYSLGISFGAALTLALAIGLGVVMLMAMLSGN